MKFFDKNQNKEAGSLTSFQEKEILGIYEKSGLLPIYREAFEKIHTEMEELRSRLIADGTPLEKVEKIIKEAEKEAQTKIVEEGNKKYLELSQQEKNSSGSSASTPRI